MKNAKYKIGDLVKLKIIDTVPLHFHNSLALISDIVSSDRANYHLSYDATKPIYVLYINEHCKELFWEEEEFELAAKA